METSQVRKRVQGAITSARARTQERRQQSQKAEQDYAVFLRDVATPIVQQIAMALKAEGYAFTASTPADGLRLVYDRGRDDFIEFALDTGGERPQVIGLIRRSSGSRRLDEERPIRADVMPSALTDEDVLQFVVQALEPWLAR